MQNSQKEPTCKKTIRHPITFVDNGEEYQVYLPDNPLSRKLFATYHACDAFGLDDDEMMAVYLYFDSRRIEGVQMQWFGAYRSAVDKLIARGWVFVEDEVAHAALRPEWETIWKAVEAAKLFGADLGRA